MIEYTIKYMLKKTLMGIVPPSKDFEMGAQFAADGYMQRVTDHAERWLLSAFAMRHIRAFEKVKRARLVFALRDTSVDNMTKI